MLHSATTRRPSPAGEELQFVEFRNDDSKYFVELQRFLLISKTDHMSLVEKMN